MLRGSAGFNGVSVSSVVMSDSDMRAKIHGGIVRPQKVIEEVIADESPCRSKAGCRLQRKDPC